MEGNEVFLTKEGYKELQDRLAYLKSEGRVDVANKIAVARSFGDISENSEYDAAREEEAQLEQEIAIIENQLRNAKIISKMKVDENVVNIGATVEVQDMQWKDKFSFKIMGSYDSDPSKGLISNESPIGKALMGKAVGDEVFVETPDPSDNDMKIKILSIKY